MKPYYFLFLITLCFVFSTAKAKDPIDRDTTVSEEIIQQEEIVEGDIDSVPEKKSFFKKKTHSAGAQNEFKLITGLSII